MRCIDIASNIPIIIITVYNVHCILYTAEAKQFKFPSLDHETIKFLYRRKADLELALRTLDSAGAVDQLMLLYSVVFNLLFLLRQEVGDTNHNCHPHLCVL
jgi:hypothetical protein